MRILYVDIDTLRPDHLSCYGYPRNTSPNIDRIARDAIRFDNCYVSDAPCLPSRAACWTGRFGIHNGIINHGGTHADLNLEGANRGFLGNFRRAQLAAILKYPDTHTVSVSPFAERHGAWWFNSGFKEMYNTGKIGSERADEIVPIALDWLDRNQDRDNWFLHVNVWDPHTTFRTPMEYGEPFGNEAPPAWPTEDVIEHHFNSYGPHGAQEVSGYAPIDRAEAFPRDLPQIKNREDYARWINGYDTGIWYADMWVGKILDKLENQGLLDDTMMVVTADHGENHGELGVYGDHHTADRITCRVPYILKVPGMTDGGRIDSALHYQMDLSATLIELLGKRVPPEWDGRSIAESLKAGKEDGRDEVIISNNAWACQRSVIWGKWLAIRTYHTGYKPFPEYMLFDMEADPQEAVNLADAHPHVLAEGMMRLEKCVSDMLDTSDSGMDPMQTVIREGGPFHANDNSPEIPTYFERLRRTERAFYADWLEENGGKPIPDDAPWAAALKPGQTCLKKPYRPV